MRIALVGAGGQLAAAVAYECAGRHEIVSFARAELDVTDEAAVAAALDALEPQAIVNGAAFNAVDAAEDQPVGALNVNAFAVRALARAARKHDATLVHYSTDFVFDGRATAPYSESERPNPQSVYAASKLMGEWFALDARAYVLRVESLFGRTPNGPPPKGSVAKLMSGMLDGAAPPVFTDRTVSPTYVLDAARATRLLLESPSASGIYHCVNSGCCTWLEFARELARQLGIEARVTPVTMADVALRAQRPKFCALSNEKLRRAGIDMPTWQHAVARLAHG